MQEKHNIRCSDCKNIVEEMLRKTYQHTRLYREHKVSVPVTLEAYRNEPYYKDLARIYRRLQSFRGNQQFVRSKQLRSCDIFITKKNIAIELDETQHFTKARAIALITYPDSLELGFNRDRWIQLCHDIDASDNDPSFRDEQRAWYDTLRDFFPLIHGFKPTQRIFMGDAIWCQLDPDNFEDLLAFHAATKGECYVYKSRKYWLDRNAMPSKNKNDTWIIVHRGIQPKIARIIAHSWHSGVLDDALFTFQAVLNAWPQKTRTQFLITPGGFVRFPWPDGFDFTGDVRKPDAKSVKKLENAALHYFKSSFKKSLLSSLSKCTRFLTLGMDSFSDEEYDILKHHVELILVYDLATGRTCMTGKFYSHISQQNTLIHHPILNSHFLTLAGDRVMILGCHDLSVFNPRARASAKGIRKEINLEFRKLAKAFQPEIVLQHPHSTDSDRIWLNSWAEMKEELPSVKYYASGFDYRFRSGKQRASLSRVLEKTRKGTTIDLVIN